VLTKKLIALTTFVFLFSLISIPNVYAWYSGYSDWQYRKSITITEQSGNTLTNYQVKLTIDTASLISEGKMNSDCSDMRFTDENDNPIPYWIESGCNSDNTIVWVKVPEISANGNATVYMYYGNPSATSESNGIDVFNGYIISADTIPSTQSSYSNDKVFISNYTISENRIIFQDGDAIEAMIKLPSGASRVIFKIKKVDVDADYSAYWTYTNGDFNTPYGTKTSVSKVYGGLIYQTPAGGSYSSTGIHVSEGIFQTLQYDYGGSRYSYAITNLDTGESKSGLDGTYTIPAIFIISGRQINDELKFVIAKKYTDPEPTYSIGPEEIPPNQPPQITISSPQNTTYFTTNILANFTVTDAETSTFPVKAYLDNQLIYDNSNYANNTEINLNLTPYIAEDKSYNFTVWANDTDETIPQISAQTVIFTVKTYPQFTNITVYPLSPQTYGVDDFWFNTTIYDELNNQQSIILETNLTGTLQNYTMLNDTPTHFYYHWTTRPGAGNYIIKFYANDTAGNTNTTNFTYIINKANANLTLQSTDGWDVYVGTTVTISASSTVQTPHLKINNITVENPYTFIPEVGFYDVYAWIDDYQNYTDWNVSETLSVMSLPTCVDNETFTFKKTINVNQQYVILNFSLPISLHHVKDDLTDVKIDGNVSSIHKNNSVIILEMNSYPSEVDVYFGNEFANYTYQEEPIPSGENIKIENYEQINSYLIVNILDEETAQPLYPPESTLYAITGCSLGQSIFRLKENTTKFLVASKTPINEMSIRVKYTADAYYKRTRFFDNITSGTINIYVSDALQHAVDRIDLTMGDPTHYNSLCQFYKKQSGHDVVITEARFDTSHQLYAFLLEDTEYNIRVIDTDGSIAEYGTITLVEYTVKTIGESSISITSSTQLISNHIIFNAYYNEDNTTHVDYIDDLDETEILTITIKNSTGDAIYENTWYNTSELHMDINTSGQNVEVDLNVTHQSLGNVKSSIFVTKSVEHNYNIGIDENKLNIFILVVLISIAGLISTRNFIAGVIIFDIALIFFKAVGWITISLVSIFFVIILTVIAVIIYIREVRL